jgi:hypothetical protein
MVSRVLWNVALPYVVRGTRRFERSVDLVARAKQFKRTTIAGQPVPKAADTYIFRSVGKHSPKNTASRRP